MLEGGDLCVQGLDMVVHGTDYRPAHGLQRLVHVHYEGVGLAAVGHEIVALELQPVVLCYLLLDGRTLNPRVRGKQLVLAGVACKVVAHIARHREPSAELEYLGAGLAALGHVHARRSLHVGQQVLALVGRYVLVNAAELLLYHRETVVYEHRGAHGDLVLVLYPVFVVDGYQRVQHVLGPLGADILDGEVDYRGLVVVEPHRKLLAICFRNRLHAAFRHIYLLSVDAFSAGSEVHPYPACGSVGFGSRPRAHADMLLLSVVDEVLEQQRAVISGTYRERHALVVTEVCEADLVGPVLPVEHLAVEASLGAVAYIQSEPLHDIHHHRGRLQRLHLVVDVGLGAEEVQVAHDSGSVAERAATAVLLLYEQRRRAGIDGRSPEYIRHARTEHEHERKREPPPPSEAEVEEFLEAERVPGALQLLEKEVGIIVVVCHGSFRLLQYDVGYEHGHRGQQRAERDPERCGAYVVAVNRGFTGLDVVGSHIHEVVLLEVERRRGVDVLSAHEVQPIDHKRVTLHALHHHLVPLAVDGEVAGHAQGVEYRHPVTLYRITPGLRHLAHHGDAEVHELHRHNRILDEVLPYELTLDEGGDLLAGHALDTEPAEHRKVDASFGVEGVARDALVLGIAGVRHSGPQGVAQLSGHIRQIEEVGQLRVTAVDYYRYLVVGTDPDFPGLHSGNAAASGLKVLEIYHFLGCAARIQQRTGGRKERGTPENPFSYHS